MAETAYLLIRVERGTPVEVARQVKRVPGVAQASVTMGDVDVLVIAHDESTKGLADIGRQVQAIEGVSTVSVCVVIGS
jgi:DNA-binding Lrp family transcriptional regulator